MPKNPITSGTFELPGEKCMSPRPPVMTPNSPNAQFAVCFLYCTGCRVPTAQSLPATHTGGSLEGRGKLISTLPTEAGSSKCSFPPRFFSQLIRSSSKKPQQTWFEARFPRTACGVTFSRRICEASSQSTQSSMSRWVPCLALQHCGGNSRMLMMVTHEQLSADGRELYTFDTPNALTQVSHAVSER